MKNKEYYINEIITAFNYDEACDFKQRHIFESTDCFEKTCGECRIMFLKWLEEEYNDSVDWTKIPINTRIMVRDNEFVDWVPRTFVFYNPELNSPFVCVAEDCDFVSFWKHGKLIEE